MSEHLTSDLIQIQTTWSIDDAADAHEALDYYDALQREASEKK